MLKQLKIKFFQVHKKIVIDFDKHITTIIGPTDGGKSTIIWALHWVVMNKPAGDNFITHDEDRTAVQAVLSDGTTVTRIKSRIANKENKYKLGKTVFKSFGSDVPSQIRTTLNMSSLNFQGQFDAPYWFSQSAGEVSRQLNAIINLGVIDSSLSNIASEVRDTRTVIGISEKRIDNFQEEKKQLAFVKKMDMDLIAVEKLYADLAETKNSFEQLALVLEECVHFGLEKKQNLQFHHDGMAVIESRQSCDTLSKDIKELTTLGREIIHNQRVVQNVPAGFEDIEELHTELQKMKDGLQAFDELLEDMQTASRENTIHKVNYDSLYDELMLQKACPICGNEMGDDDGR